MEYKTKYAIHLRWYGLVNYLIAVSEQIALWKFGLHTFFWWALALNILGVVGLTMTINKIEKQII